MARQIETCRSMQKMDNGKLTELLWHDAAEVPAPTPFCPEERLVVAYFEGSLAERELQALQHHVSACQFCLARLGNLGRSDNDIDEPAVAADVLAEAKGLARPVRGRAISRRAAAWATAAVVVLALFLVVGTELKRPHPQETDRLPEPSIETGSPQLRSLGQFPREVQIISPAHGDIIGPGAAVRWSALPGSDRYELIILSAAGDVVWAERLGETSWTPQVAHGLKAGSRYYLRVEAVQQDGSTLSSRHVEFWFAER